MLGSRSRARWGRVCASALLALTLLLVPVAVLGGDPSSAPPVIGSGDSRSDGGGPGLVGSPVLIAVGVVVLGAVTALGTLLVLRVTGSRRAS